MFGGNIMVAKTPVKPVNRFSIGLYFVVMPFKKKPYQEGNTAVLLL